VTMDRVLLGYSWGTAENEVSCSYGLKTLQWISFERELYPSGSSIELVHFLAKYIQLVDQKWADLPLKFHPADFGASGICIPDWAG
jgi:hypothetical protein